MPFTFDQLSESAKDRVRDRHRYSPDYPEEGWDECILDDWREKLEAAGFDEPKIEYSGFCCQGDGACFTAQVKDSHLQPPEELLTQMKETAAASWILLQVTGSADDKRWLHSPDRLLQGWMPEIRVRIEKLSGNYSHSNMIVSHVEDYTRTCTGMPEDLANAIGHWIDSLESEWQDLARSLSDDIYRDLEEAYDSEMSDERLDDILSDSDDLFNADGDEWEDWMAEEEEEEPELQAA